MNKAFERTMRMLLALLVVATLAANGDSCRMTSPVDADTLRFSDESVMATFSFSREDGYYRRIGFTLENLSSDPITIDWDNSSITLPSNEASNVLREGMDYSDAGDSVAPTTVPPGTRVIDALCPTRNIEYTPPDVWSLLPMRIQVGTEVGLHLAVSGGKEDRLYDFRFTAITIEDPLPTAYFESTTTASGAIQATATRASDPERNEASYSWDF